MKKVFVKILLCILSVFCLCSITFIMMKVVPGGPFDTDKPLPDQVRFALENKYHLHESIWLQYIYYLKNLIHGSFGVSTRYYGQREVLDIFKEAVPVSIVIGVFASLISFFVGTLFGIFFAIKERSKILRILFLINAIGLSLPNFIMCCFAILLFTRVFQNVLPILWVGWQSIVLPSFILSVHPSCVIMRLIYHQISLVKSQDFIRAAHARGLSESYILFKHVLKNAVLPSLTYIGPVIAALVSGSVVVETVFSIPGLGRHLVSAVLARDYFFIMAATMFYGTLIIVINCIVDLLSYVVDPRLRD